MTVKLLDSSLPDLVNYFSLATNLVCFLVLCRWPANLFSPFFFKSLSFDEK